MLNSPEARPAPIYTSPDNPFAHDTMIRRVPATIKRIQHVNPDYPDIIQNALEELSHDIQNDDPITMLSPLAPDYAYWHTPVEIRHTESWLNTQWFFAETYFYRRLIECVRWFETGRDPFLPIKQEEYASDALWKLLDTALKIDASPKEKLTELIKLILWGNRIDLSFEASFKRGMVANDEDLIVDDSKAAVQQLLNGRGDVHFIIDNAGTELTMDLALVDALLEVIPDTIILHLKMHPTFISDALPVDVFNFFALLDERGGHYSAFATRLRNAFDTGRLQLIPNFFWNSSQWLWEIPDNLIRAFSSARLVLVKGDANYRRIVGDALWKPETPFIDVMGYFPAPLVALRTLKSDPIVGLASGLAQQLDQKDAEWRVNGQRGVIQFKP